MDIDESWFCNLNNFFWKKKFICLLKYFNILIKVCCFMVVSFICCFFSFVVSFLECFFDLDFVFFR